MVLNGNFKLVDLLGHIRKHILKNDGRNKKWSGYLQNTKSNMKLFCKITFFLGSRLYAAKKTGGMRAVKKYGYILFVSHI